MPTISTQPAFPIRIWSSAPAARSALSNFLLWQAAYSEFVFLPCFWPDFSRADLVEAIRAYAARERRYGGVPARDVACDGAGSGRSSPRTSGPKRLTNLQIRVLSSIVLVVAVLALTWLGGLPSACSAASSPARSSTNGRACAARMRVGGLGLPARGADAGLRCGALIAGLPAADAAGPGRGSGAGRRRLRRRCAGASQWEAGGLAYAALSGFSLAYLRGSDHAGLVAILFLFAVVWATDILAYFVGRALGGPKLAPSISPGKTWSGAIGGAVGGLLAGVAIAALTGWGGLVGRGGRACCSSIVVADRRPVRIVRQAAQRRQGFQPHHSRPWRRHGPRRRTCRRRLHPIRDRRAVRQRRQSSFGIGWRLIVRPTSMIYASTSHGFAGIEAKFRVGRRSAILRTFLDRSLVVDIQPARRVARHHRAVPVRADGRRLHPRDGPLSGRPLVRHRRQGVLDRLRPGTGRLQRPPRHALEAVRHPARRLRQVRRRHECGQPAGRRRKWRRFRTPSARSPSTRSRSGSARRRCSPGRCSISC